MQGSSSSTANTTLQGSPLHFDQRAELKNAADSTKPAVVEMLLSAFGHRLKPRHISTALMGAGEFHKYGCAVVLGGWAAEQFPVAEDVLIPFRPSPSLRM